MKRGLTLALFCLSSACWADTYTGHISVVSMSNANGSNIVFELVDHTSDECESGWFKVQKPGARELSPAELVVNSYFQNSKITVHSPNVCSPVTAPSVVNRVTVGTSNEDVKALIEKVKAKRAKKD